MPDAGDDAHRPTAHRTGLDIDPENALQELCLGHRYDALPRSCVVCLGSFLRSCALVRPRLGNRRAVDIAWSEGTVTNQIGLQHRNARDEWELTERGREWAEAMTYCRHNHSGYQILWNPAVVSVLRELA